MLVKSMSEMAGMKSEAPVVGRRSRARMKKCLISTKKWTAKLKLSAIKKKNKFLWTSMMSPWI